MVMAPVDFPETNQVWAEHQSEYLPLPSFVAGDVTTSCWRMSWLDRIIALFTGRVWLRTLNFRTPLQPQAVSVRSPFRS